MTRFNLAAFVGVFLLLPAEAPAQVTESWLPGVEAVEMRELTLGSRGNRDVLEKAVFNDNATDPWYAMLGLRQCNAEDTVESFNSLGIMYARGIGVERDPQKSLTLFLTAASYRYPEAMINLATMYTSGIGTKRDNEVAYGWLRAAIVFGAADRALDIAVSRLAVIASILGRAKLPRADRIARTIVISLLDEAGKDVSSPATAPAGVNCTSAAIIDVDAGSEKLNVGLATTANTADNNH